MLARLQPKGRVAAVKFFRLSLRKTLPLCLPSFDATAFQGLSQVLRKIFKYSCTKKIRVVTIEADIFRNLAHHLPNSLRKITFKRTGFPARIGTPRTNKTPARRSFESQKNLKELQIRQNINPDQIKAARKLPNLERFCLTILESDIPSIYNLFQRGMNRLHTVQLMIQKDKNRTLPWTPQQTDRMWMFLKHLIKLKKLKALSLNIQDCFITKDPRFFYRLLGMLSDRSNIETLGLILHLPMFEDNEQNGEANQILSQVQELDIISHQYYVLNVDFHTINSKEKKVRISFLPNNQQEKIDISKLIAKCSTLKTLNLEDHVGKLVVSPDSQLIAKLESLKLSIDHKDDQKVLELLHYLSNSSQNQHILHFSIALYHLTDDILKKLIKINHSFSPNKIQEYWINTKDVNYCNPDFDDTQRANFFSKLPRSELFCQFFESISRFTSLTSLEILTRIEEIAPVESLISSLTNLQDLKQLAIQIYGKEKTSSHESLPIDIPVYNLHDLRSLTLKLSFNFRFRDFFGFLEKMAEVQKLKSFALDCVDIDPTDQESIKKIAKTLDKFPICQRILVDRENDDESLCLSCIDAANKSLRKKPGK